MNHTYKSISEITPLNDYPRPHLQRQLWLNLNGIWSFTITYINETWPKDYERIIVVPFPVESYLSGINERVDSTMFLWYKRKFNILPLNFHFDNHQQSRILLHFDKVDYETVVYINQHIVGLRHLGGYDPFSFDITSYIKNNENNEIIVRVWDPSNHWYQARGKQRLDVDDPKSIFYTPCSGIWGTVWLEKVPYIHIDRLQFITKISSTKIHLKYRIDLHESPKKPNDPLEERDEQLNIPLRNYENEGYQLKITILKQNQEQLISFTTTKINQDDKIIFSLSEINLWSPQDPYLYNLKIDFYKKDSFIEHIDSYIGFRQISLCLKRKKICLNHRPYFMFGVLDQGYWPDGLYRPQTDDAYRHDIEQMKKLGFNTLRKHMKVETSRWYYWCDVLGMLVWQDMPAGDSYDGYEVEFEEDKQLRLHRDYGTNFFPLDEETNITQRNNIKRRYQSKIQFEYELKTMIDFLSFHPSIVVWVLFNEAWGQYDTVRLGTWLQNYDRNRLVDAASGWQDRRGIGHIRDIHDYTEHILLPSIDNHRRALVIGECGGFGLTNSGWSYNHYVDRYFMTYAFEQLIIHLSTRLSAMIYTQLSDVENEKNGILTYNRKTIKFIPDHMQRVLQKDFSRLYNLVYIWNLTSIPYINYTQLSLSRLFYLNIDRNLSDFYRFYFYTCYLNSLVNITIDKHRLIILNETYQIENYHYIPLPTDLFQDSLNQEHSIDISLNYISSVNRTEYTTHVTFFDLSLALLFE